MRQHELELARLDIQVAVITFEEPWRVEAYIQETGDSWPILIDPSRSLYQAYGMERGRSRDIFGWASWLSYARLMLRGRRLRRATSDIYQRGGDVLIDPDGVVRLCHVGQHPADRPAVKALLEIVHQAG